MTLRGRASPFLWVLLVFTLGCAVRAQSFSSSFRSDDFLFLDALHGHPLSSIDAPFHLYRFTDGHPEQVRAARVDGYISWWHTLPHRFAFFRPLSSALMWLDFHLFGDAQLGYRIHSMLWFGLAMVAAMLFLSQLISWRAAVLTVACFAVDVNNFRAMSWWCNRHQLVAGTFALFALAAHVRWRVTARVRWLGWSLLAWTLAFLGGEVALQAVGYVVAYALLDQRLSLRRRLATLAPVVVLALSYLIARALSHAGVDGNEGYVDPLTDPRAFVVGVPVQLGNALANAIVKFQILFREPGFGTRTLIAIAVSAGLLAALIGLVRSWAPTTERRSVEVLLLGSFLAVFPGLGKLLAASILLIPAIGVDALFAVTLLCAIARVRAAGPGRVAAIAFGASIIVLHGVSAMRIPALLARTERRCARELASTRQLMALARPTTRTVLVVADAFAAEDFSPLAVVTGLGWQVPVTRCFRLTSTDQKLRLTRSGPSVFELVTVSGAVLSDDALVDRALTLHGLEVRVLDFVGERPARVEFTLDVPLEDSTLLFVARSEEGVSREIALPSIGQSLEVSP